MLLTFKDKLKLTEEQKQFLWLISEEARQLYNNLLSEKNQFYDENKKYLNYYEQQKRLKNYPTEYLTYDMKKEICRVLDNNYKSFFALLKSNPDINPKPPKYRGKKYFFTLSYVQDFIILDDILRLSNKMTKFLDLEINNPFKDNESIKLRNKSKSLVKTCKIFYDDSQDDFFYSITYEHTEKEEKEELYNLAIDLGKKNLVSYFDEKTNKGVTFNSKDYYKNEKYFDKRISEINQKRDKKIKGSKKWEKLNKKKRKLEKKKNKQNKLALHVLSKRISKLERNMVIGELTNLKRNTLSDYRKQNRECQNNWQLMTLVDLLDYKCKKEGRKLTKVNEAWTSKTCYKCGTIDHALTPSDRVYQCETCGNIIDRDINSSINILKVYKQTIKGDYSTPQDVKTSERLFGNFRKVNSFYINL